MSEAGAPSPRASGFAAAVASLSPVGFTADPPGPPRHPAERADAGAGRRSKTETRRRVRGGAAPPQPVGTRSLSGTMLQRSATVRSSSLSGHESGRSSPSCDGRAALQRHAAGVLADRFDLLDLRRARARSRSGPPARSARLSSIGRAASPGSWISVGATQATGRWARVHWQASWSDGEAVPLGDRAQQLEPVAAVADPSGGPKGAVVLRRQLALVGHVTVEDAAVIDHARDGAHVVPLEGRQHEARRPGLERAEDDHRPVDAVAEALEAVDEVEREPVRRAGSDPDRTGQTLLAQAGHRAPDVLGGVPEAVRVVQHQQVEVVAAAPLEAALGGRAQVVGVAAPIAQGDGSVKRG